MQIKFKKRTETGYGVFYRGNTSHIQSITTVEGRPTEVWVNKMLSTGFQQSMIVPRKNIHVIL
jgi:hypothetical protein